MVALLTKQHVDDCWSALADQCGSTLSQDQSPRWGKAIVTGLQNSSLVLSLDEPRLTFGRRDLWQSLRAQGVFEETDSAAACSFTDAEIADYGGLIARGIELLDLLPGDRGQMLRQLIPEISTFRVTRPEAGTISSMIGLIYLNYRPEWSAVQMAEILWHEVGHTALNLIDMTHGLMPEPDLLDDPANRCYSAVRHEPRGFFSAYHAAFVAALLIPFHHDLVELGEPNQPRLIRELREHGRRAVRELRAVQLHTAAAGRPILTELGAEWLDRMATAFDLAPTPTFDFWWPFLGSF